MTDPFTLGAFFHIYSRTNGEELLFREEKNSRYFLQKYLHYCSSHFSTIAYCLLPNHFHFLVRAKEDIKPEAALNSFSNFLNGYAKAYNKLYDRHWGLFQRKFKRKEVDKECYLTQAIVYIHQNPHKHGIVVDFKNWKFSSFQAIISQKQTYLDRDFVLNWFGGIDQFQKVHALEISSSFPEELALE